jgi:hypothetical protein
MAQPDRVKVLYPPNLSGLTLPRFPLALDESANSTQSHVVKPSNFYAGMTGFDCRNHPFAQIVGIRLAHS